MNQFTKNQELNNSKKKRQLKDSNTKLTQMFNYTDKTLKAVIIPCFME